MNPNDTTAAVVHQNNPVNGLFSIDPGLAIWTWVVFGLLFIILRKYAWTPMMNSISARERLVADTIDNARKTREELEKIAVSQQAMIRDAQNEASKIIEDGRKTAESTAQLVIDRAHKEAQAALEDAKAKITTEKENALKQIKNQTIELVINTSEKLIEESLNDETHRKIVEKHLDKL